MNKKSLLLLTLYTALIYCGAGIAAENSSAKPAVNVSAPDGPEAYVRKGIKALRENRLTDARKLFLNAKKINPKFAPAYVGEAEVLTMQNAYDEALALLNRALELDPQFGIAYHNRGLLYYYRDQFPEALRDFKKSEQLGESVEPDVLYQVWGAVEPDEIIKMLNDRIQANPQDGQSYLNRGVANYYKQDYQATLNDWKKARELGVQPDNNMWAEVERQIQMEKGAKRATS